MRAVLLSNQPYVADLESEGVRFLGWLLGIVQQTVQPSHLSKLTRLPTLAMLDAILRLNNRDQRAAEYFLSCACLRTASNTLGIAVLLAALMM